MSQILCRYGASSWYTTGTNSGSINCDFVLLGVDEFSELTQNEEVALSELFDEYFAFDLEVFSAITAIALTLFIVGYGLGRVSRIFSKI